MTDISNEADFKRELESLDDLQQRQVAALFVNHVLSLSEDKRLERVVKDRDADADAQRGTGGRIEIGPCGNV